MYTPLNIIINSNIIFNFSGDNNQIKEKIDRMKSYFDEIQSREKIKPDQNSDYYVDFIRDINRIFQDIYCLIDSIIKNCELNHDYHELVKNNLAMIESIFAIINLYFQFKDEKYMNDKVLEGLLDCAFDIQEQNKLNDEFWFRYGIYYHFRELDMLMLYNNISLFTKRKDDYDLVDNIHHRPNNELLEKFYQENKSKLYLYINQLMVNNERLVYEVMRNPYNNHFYLFQDDNEKNKFLIYLYYHKITNMVYPNDKETMQVICVK